ncbi:hypothetical protein CC80DRAFT_139006 [Byssothecium circinans]|uniref:Uncharacterized protein n=1 Tax=Byssothecium circinans TaxID=147558 RepID=A0A6A5TLN3_9PLEO|nr:hypothetical protein CC80DRAFT_139006 [Byssothecium circinans]
MIGWNRAWVRLIILGVTEAQQTVFAIYDPGLARYPQPLVCQLKVSILQGRSSQLNIMHNVDIFGTRIQVPRTIAEASCLSISCRVTARVFEQHRRVAALADTATFAFIARTREFAAPFRQHG